MPGSSLWLLPPRASAIEKKLTELTQKTFPSAFSYAKPFPIMYPHVTLTSYISDSITDREDREKWLDSLPLKVKKPPVVQIQVLDIGDIVVQKCTLRVAKEGSLMDLAVRIRAAAAEGDDQEAAKKWAAITYRPHVSMLYADVQLGDEEASKARQLVRKSGIQIPEPGEDAEPSSSGRWEGGRVIWVDTRGEIADWKVLGERDLTVLAD